MNGIVFSRISPGCLLLLLQNSDEEKVRYKHQSSVNKEKEKTTFVVKIPSRPKYPPLYRRRVLMKNIRLIAYFFREFFFTRAVYSVGHC